MVGLVSLWEGQRAERPRSARRGHSPAHPCWDRDVRFAASKSMRNKWLLHKHLVYSALLQKPELVKTICMLRDGRDFTADLNSSS